MARHKEKKKPKDRSVQVLEISETMRTHLQTLGHSKDSYLRWCKEKGFGVNFNKSWREIQNERLEVSRDKAQKVRDDARIRFRRPEVLVRAFINGEKVKLPSGMSELERFPNIQKIRPLVLLLLDEGIDLFEKIAPNVTFLTAAANVMDYAEFWIRPLADWTPKTHNLKRQFSSLVRHLFAKYDVPLFMDEAWHPRPAGAYVPSEYPVSKSRLQEWFIHLGTGQNIRTASALPFPLTKKMAHYFCQAPSDWKITEALRYGQVRALGGDKSLIHAMRNTNITLGKNEDFWESVIRWFIENPMLDRRHVGPIIDYIEFQRFTTGREIRDGRTYVVPPPQPNLSMKKRDPEATLKAVEEWHKRLGREKRAGTLEWLPLAGVQPFEFTEGINEHKKTWTIHELLTSGELKAEGKAMHHCVSSYADSCQEKRCSIWSLKCDGERQITIEVRNREICQSRGKYNAMMTPKQKLVIGRWASQNGLTLRSYA